MSVCIYFRKFMGTLSAMRDGHCVLIKQAEGISETWDS